MSKLDTENLVEYEVPEGEKVLSVYLQTHSAESETVLREELKKIEGRFEAESEEGEFEQCVKRVWEFLYKFEARSPMLVLFCTATGSMWARQIEIVLPNAVRWDDLPYWTPFIEVIDEFEPYGVLLIGKEDARLFNVGAGRIHEHDGIRRQPGEKTDAYLKKIVAATEAFIRTEGPSRLILAGDRDLGSGWLRAAPSFLQKAVIAVVQLPVASSAQTVLESTRRLAELAERRFEVRQVDQLIRLAVSHSKVTVGLASTLEALNDGRVSRLVYADSFAAGGSRCPACSRLYPEESALCAKCNVSVRPVDDILASAVAYALNSDASIEEVRGEASARLAEVGGIGAFLRF